MIRPDGSVKKSLNTYGLTSGGPHLKTHDLKESLISPISGDPNEPMQIKSELMNQSQTSSTGGAGATAESRGSAVKSARNGYREKALAEIRNSLQPFAHGDRGSSNSSESSLTQAACGSSVSGSSCSSSSNPSALSGIDKLVAMGYSEEWASRILQLQSAKTEFLDQQQNQEQSLKPPEGINGLSAGSKPLRKSSLQDSCWDSRGGLQQPCSPPESSNVSVRSESPSISSVTSSLQRMSTTSDGVLSPTQSSLSYYQRMLPNQSEPPPPLPPPRGMSAPPPTPPRGTTPPTPPPPPPPPSHNIGGSIPPPPPPHHHPMFKRRSPVPQNSRPSFASSSNSPQRGTSPVSSGGRTSVSSLAASQQLQLGRYSGCGSTTSGSSSQRTEPPPPYPSGSSPSPASFCSIYSSPPPSYASSSSGRQSPTPTISSSEYSIPPLFNQKRLASPAFSYGTPSAGSPMPMLASNCSSTGSVGSSSGGPAPATVVTSIMPRPTPLQAWSVKQAKSQSPVIMQSVKSTQVQKPVLQTAVAPTAPPPVSSNNTTPPPAPPTGYAPGPQPANQVSYYTPFQTAISVSYPASPTGMNSSGPETPSCITSPPPYTSAVRKNTGIPTRATHLPYSAGKTNGNSYVPSHLPYNSPPKNQPGDQQDFSCRLPSYNNQNQNTISDSKIVSNQRFAIAPATHLDLNSVEENVPTTDPPSYAMTVAVFSGQILTPSAVTPALNNNIHCYAGPNQGATTGHVPLDQLDNFSAPSGVSDLVSTVESICNSNNSPPSEMNLLRANSSAGSTNGRNLNACCGLPSALLSCGAGGGSEYAGLQQQRGKASPCAMDTASSTSWSASRSESPVSHGLSQSPVSFMSTTSSPSTQSDSTGNSGCRGMPPPPPYKTTHQSPIPPRKILSKEKEEEKKETKVRNFSPAAFKFFMEQHVENLLKSHQQRERRRQQLETEMAKVGLSEEAQCQVRRMLYQKESNYIRLKRAKMDKSMFVKIRAIGVGAFGEVALVRKVDTNQLYAMKTLRKTDVLKRNQVAHVKAERDILAEADNEWVVKLYYSFQDTDNLYFVMDYIPGGDLMSLLIKLSIFQEPLARFYIAELVLAVESVHKMGFIHRDIKPDNILIDRDGHIKLTDFGLCTGFRWTHNSKYYQRNGEHARQDSMEPDESWSNECHCYTNSSIPTLKPLERRRRREHQRCLAHSLVGTPNYIAPEVLMRTGYTQLCDWWSVGVILYEMLVGQPPFLANSPGETQLKVINWETTLHIPKAAMLSPASTDFILKLCCGPDKRLGHNGADEIKVHPFFAGIDFEGGLRKQPAPYIPQILYATDTSNFDPIDSEKLKSEFGSEDKAGENGKHPEHAFFEFTFRRFFDDGGQAYPVRVSNLDDNDNQGSPVYV